MRFANCSRLTIIRHELVRDQDHESFKTISNMSRCWHVTQNWISICALRKSHSKSKSHLNSANQTQYTFMFHECNRCFFFLFGHSSIFIGKHYGKSVDWLDSTGKELSLWQSMINRPNFWVEGCVVLRSTFDSAGTTN